MTVVVSIQPYTGYGVTVGIAPYTGYGVVVGTLELSTFEYWIKSLVPPSGTFLDLALEGGGDLILENV